MSTLLIRDNESKLTFEQPSHLKAITKEHQMINLFVKWQNELYPENQEDWEITDKLTLNENQIVLTSFLKVKREYPTKWETEFELWQK